MTAAMSSPDRFGSLLRGLLKKNIPNMVYLTVIGFIGIPLPYLRAMFPAGRSRNGGSTPRSGRPTRADSTSASRR